MTVAPSAFDRVLDDIGTAIVGGELADGHRDTVEGLGQRTGASRSIVREATRVLVSLGMLHAGRRVGLLVLPRDSWNVLDPLVIRWRLAGADRDVQLEELRALRLAVEPEAARLAAERIGLEERTALAAATRDLDVAGSATTGGAGWVDADRALHALVLRLSGNVMFIHLQSVIDAALRERESVPLTEDAVARHRAVADAIGSGDGVLAAALLREIIADTHA